MYRWRQARREAAGVLRAAADGARRAAGAMTGSAAVVVDLAVGGRATVAF